MFFCRVFLQGLNGLKTIVLFLLVGVSLSLGAYADPTAVASGTPPEKKHNPTKKIIHRNARRASDISYPPGSNTAKYPKKYPDRPKKAYRKNGQNKTAMTPAETTDGTASADGKIFESSSGVILEQSN